IIWPLFHDMPTRCNFDPDYWEIYQRVNRKFAKVISDVARDDDFIWVHDYHLMLTAKYLRDLGVKSRIGFFLHIPFPCSDIFEKLPWREPLANAMLEYDVIGFQSERDRHHFISCARNLVRKDPEMRGKGTLVQVVVPSREDIPRYKDLRSDLELLVSRINGEFTHEGWVPIHYMHRNLGRDELLAFYRAADVALITPLKDGMNLVAKEFCAAQADERGVLIVSEFAGAGPELRHGALLVNPNDLAGVA